MTMKSTYKAIVGIVAVLAMVMAAGVASALTVKTITVQANAEKAQNLGSYDTSDILTFSWSSSEAISAVLTGPGGFSEPYAASIAGGDTIIVSEQGSYTLTLTNANSVPATVTLTYTSSGTEVGNIVNTVILIGVIIIVIVIVVVVLVVVLGMRKKKQTATAAGAPPNIVTPTTPGVCPVCGAQTDTNAQFCAKCGARFH